VETLIESRKRVMAWIGMTATRIINATPVRKIRNVLISISSLIVFNANNIIAPIVYFVEG